MNVLFLMDDQHHPEAISCLRNCPKGIDGKPLVETPNLNRLVSSGVRFRHAYTPTAICGPSRTCFFTGTYVFTHGHYGNNNDVPLEASLPSLTDEFSRHDYVTAAFGKRHLPESLSAAFDHEMTFEKAEGALAFRAAANPADSDLNTPRNGMQFLSWTSNVPKDKSSEAWTTNRAIEFLQDRQAGEKPFFAWVSFERPHAPHTPDSETEKLVDPARVPLPWDDYDLFEQTKLQPRMGCEDYWKLGGWDDPTVFQRAVARYYSLIGLIDEQIGRILDTLEKCGLAQDTLVVFCPDHGDFGGDFGQLGKNVPVYEQLYKVPLLWCDPTRPQDHGKVIEGLWQTIDLFPSLMERLGWQVPPRVQGQSFLSAIDGWRPIGRDCILMETPMCRVLRTREHKLAFHVDHPDDGQLFDMLPVPDELHNHWDDPDYRDVRDRLVRRLLAQFIGQEQFRSAMTDWEPLMPTRYNRAQGWMTHDPAAGI